MTPRKAALMIGAGLIFLTSVPGLWSGARGIQQAVTPGQKATVAGDLVYGAMGLVIVLLIGIRKFAPLPLLIGWAILVTGTAAIAPFAWGATRAEAGVLAGLSAAIVVAAAVWLASRGLRAPEN